jgi:hypothetical protein
MANGPGPEDCAFSPGRGKSRRTVSFGTAQQGFSSSARQAMSHQRGARAHGRADMRIAATGLAKNSVPKREKQKSRLRWSG